MAMTFVATTAPTKEVDAVADRFSTRPVEIEVGLLTGCRDRPYAFGLATALVSRGVCLDVIGSDEEDSPELHSHHRLNFLNLWGNQQAKASTPQKLAKLFTYYRRLIRYAARAKPKIFHILWNNKFELFDRTLLMLYYKVRGKKIALTAHNVNQAKRDGKDSLLNRLTLKAQYRLSDHIFVHTPKMKAELVKDFGLKEQAVTVIRHPINNAFPDTRLNPAEAKAKLAIGKAERTILFFGRIRPYKGLEYLLSAFELLKSKRGDYRLIIAGEPKKGSEDYLWEIQQATNEDVRQGRIISKIQHIPDGDIELYFKAADVLVLPYKDIFQSGVLFLAYSFGLPVVATDVGSFRDEIIEGRTGFLCEPGDPDDLAKGIEKYFESDLFKFLIGRREELKKYANDHHSWDSVAELTENVYAELLRLDHGTSRIHTHSCV
jgi:D-inositol-3-phosphate glycosyltransferase